MCSSFCILLLLFPLLIFFHVPSFDDPPLQMPPSIEDFTALFCAYNDCTVQLRIFDVDHVTGQDAVGSGISGEQKFIQIVPVKFLIIDKFAFVGTNVSLSHFLQISLSVQLDLDVAMLRVISMVPK
ncbi:hypothetical protein BDQ17DRAFT_1339886 [Cyathus striatus]|nr:hypothetical protein BDQ17DRAFT_1339886 [Cyathus striatus]